MRRRTRAAARATRSSRRARAGARLRRARRASRAGCAQPRRAPFELDDWVVPALQDECRLAEARRTSHALSPSVDRGHVAACDSGCRAGTLQAPPRGVRVRDPGEPAVPVATLAPVRGRRADEVPPRVELLVAQLALRAPVEPSGGGVEQDELRHAIRTRGGRQARGDAALRDADHRRPLEPGGVHDRDELIDPYLHRRRRVERIRGPRARLVVYGNAGESRELGEELARAGYSQNWSTFETQPGTIMISAGPSPKTCHAMLTPSCSR